MVFAHDTQIALTEAAALVNTLSDGVDELETTAGLDAFLARYPLSGVRRGTEEELEQVRQLRTRLRTLWTAADRDEAAAIVNAILAEADARPYLTKHDEWDWHLHRDPARRTPGRPDRGRGGDGGARPDPRGRLGRLRICAADDCADVLVDLSRNSSKRFCDTGNCGNRTNVAAYRARKRAASAG